VRSDLDLQGPLALQGSWPSPGGRRVHGGTGERARVRQGRTAASPCPWSWGNALLARVRWTKRIVREGMRESREALSAGRADDEAPGPLAPLEGGLPHPPVLEIRARPPPAGPRDPSPRPAGGGTGKYASGWGMRPRRPVGSYRRPRRPRAVGVKGQVVVGRPSGRRSARRPGDRLPARQHLRRAGRNFPSPWRDGSSIASIPRVHTQGDAESKPSVTHASR
jgi:hypothetical protein